jgi:putative ABC transport system substrate-binding protein
MNRRELLLLLGGTLTAARAVGAQQKAMPVIGYLDSGSADRSQVSAFRAGLGEAGYEEGRNVTIEYRWADGQYDRLPTLAGDLVRRQVAVIAASSTPAALAAKGATATIPIVFTTGNDPVAVGLVASLSRPGGNLTGVTRINLQLGPKRLELLHELVPTATAIGLLVNPTNPNAETLPKDVKAAVDILGLKIQMLQARTDTDLVSVFGALGRLRAGGLLIGPDPFFNMRIERICASKGAPHWRSIMRCPRSTSIGRLSRLVAWRAIVPALRIRIVGSASTPVEYSAAPSRPSYRSSSRRPSSWSSISRPPRNSASPCRHRSSPAPTR